MQIIKKEGTILKSEYHNKYITFDLTYPLDNTPKPIVLFIHGFKGFKDWGHFPLIAENFAQKGCVFIKMNFSHNGTTPYALQDFVDLEAFGNNNFTIELADIKTVIDHLVEGNKIPIEEINLEHLYLVGHSRGGSVGFIYTTLDKRVKKLVTWSAVCHVYDRYTQDEKDSWKEKGVQYIFNSRTNQQMPLYYQLAEDLIAKKNIYNIPEIAKKIHIPYLAIHGSNDQTVDYREANELHKLVKDSHLEIIEGSDHTFSGKHPWEANTLPRDTQLLCEKTINFLLK